jgi:hypothetical protein
MRHSRQFNLEAFAVAATFDLIRRSDAGDVRETRVVSAVRVDNEAVRMLERAPSSHLLLVLDGAVVASFERDRHTGIIRRNGDAYLYPPSTALNRWHTRTA